MIARALAGACAAACTSAIEPPAEPLPITVMTYNLANLQGEAALGPAAYLARVAPGVAAVQECAACDHFLASLPARYQLAAPARAGVSLIYDSESFLHRDGGFIRLGDSDDGWGERVAAWAILTDLATGGSLALYSTHFCVTIRAPDDACDVARQLDYAAALQDHARTGPGSGLPVVLAGDFNVFDGFADGPVVSAIAAGGFTDVVRAFAPDSEPDTFIGNTWAPPGRIDYIFATEPVSILDAFVDQDDPGQGSDHHPIIARLEFLPLP